MAKINRFNGNVREFAADAADGTERTVFGNVGVQSDELDDNMNPAFFRGWGVLNLLANPPRQWFAAIGFTLGRLIAYLYQWGVPEWNTKQEFNRGSRTVRNGVLYRSRVDLNVGNDPGQDNGTSWIPDGSFGKQAPGDIEDASAIVMTSEAGVYTLPETSGLRDGATVRLSKDAGLASPRFASANGELIKQYNYLGDEVNSDTVYDYDAFVELVLTWNAAAGYWEF